ncbi:MAG TPA: UDP-forming cellulose synthase catalytic subunit [Gallionellaceae bacterium]
MNIRSLVPSAGRAERTWVIAMGGMLLIGMVFYCLQKAYTYFGMDQELYVGWGCFIAIYIAYRIKAFRRQPWRFIFILLSAFLALRYMEWRALHTLIYTGPLDFIGMALLFLAELYGLVIYLLGMFVNFNPLESKHIPLPEDPDKLPTVDVFIPTYNEPLDIIRITATAAAQIAYPKEKLKIYILDDGGTHAKRSHPEAGMRAWERHYSLRQMAADLGVGYITRETNQQAKAGNINHALQYTDGELLLILDCDHVPTKDILQYTAGHFIADPKLFLVQTPHFFINPTPVDKNFDGASSLPGENDMFYRSIHPALNFWNASYFCGSAALLRRKYLQEVGGIRGATITEDAETSFHLHSRGYNSVYVNKPMVCGLSPESYEDYVTQRSRWAQGMVQLVMLYNPLKPNGLSWAQKFAYFNSSLFWFFGFPRFIYFLAPASYLVLGLHIYHASGAQVLAFTLPYVFSIYLVMGFFYGGSRQIFFSEIYESVQSMFLMPVVFSVLLNPGSPSFQVTPKGMTNERNYLSPLAAPFLLVVGLNVFALMLAVDKWSSSGTNVRDMILVTSVWTFYNVYLALMSLGALWERKQMRKFYRIVSRGSVKAHFPRMGATHEGEEHDVSLTGIGFTARLPFLPQEQEEVVLEVQDSYGRVYRFESRIQRAARYRGRYFCGSEFVRERVSYADAVSYVFGDSRRWQENWDRKSVFNGGFRTLWRFFRRGARALWRGLPLLGERVRRVTLSLLRAKLLSAASWMVYYAALAASYLVELLDHKQVRSIERIGASMPSSIYIPRMNATLLGQVVDCSVTGVGVVVDLPFELRQPEKIAIKATGRDGRNYQLECMVRRTSKDGDKSFCGAEFIVNMLSYPRIVNFVHGDNQRMLRNLLMPSGSSEVGQGYAAKVAGVLRSSVLVRLLAYPARVLAVLFLTPSYRTAYSREKRTGVLR